MSHSRLLEISAVRVVKPWLQIGMMQRLLAPDLYAESQKCNKLLEDFVGDIVRNKHRNWRLRETAGEDAPSGGGWQRRIFIEQIFQLAANGEMTLEEIMDEAQSMVLVSFETVSNSIMLALLCLATNRGDCRQRLKAEIAAVVPENGGGYVGLEQLQQLRYLDAFVSESLRLLATVPMNLRHVSRDFQLPGREAIVPQNSIVVLDTFNMQRDDRWWGATARQFDPQRFLDQDHDQDESSRQQQKDQSPTKKEPLTRRHSYSFLPFSKGLRSCIGQFLDYYYFY